MKIRDLHWDKDTSTDKGKSADLWVFYIPEKMHEMTVTLDIFKQYVNKTEFLALVSGLYFTPTAYIPPQILYKLIMNEATNNTSISPKGKIT